MKCYIDCTFTENETDKGAGAIWAGVAVGETEQTWEMEVNMDGCKFFRNKVNDGGQNDGGGAVWMSAAPNPEFTQFDAVIHGTWTDCQFIENEGFKGGAAYFSSIGLFEIKDCLFVANHAKEGGGGICVSDPKEAGDTVVRICNTDFIANTAIMQGGAVYNRQASKTTLVNCIMAGNTTDKTGGATCNADGGDIPDGALTELNLHNCLIAGNEAVTSGADGGGCYNRDGGFSEMINCTVVKNEAEDQFGGAANIDPGSDLIVQNCIVWGNDDSGSSAIDNQLVYLDDDPADLEVDQNVIEDCNDSCFPGTNNSNKGQGQGEDPDVLNTTTGMTWLDCTYDAAKGISTFNITVEVTGFTNQRLFQPDGTSPLQLLITSVDEGDGTISCYGNWTDLHSLLTKTGTIFDYHIASGSSAIDFGDVNHLPDDDCDLDNNQSTTTLNKDLDLETRDVNGPDSGAYEVPD